MTIYYFLVMLILILNVLRKRGAVSDKFFSIVICSAFILVTGLRGRSVGADTWNYHDSFYFYENFRLEEVIALGKSDFGFFIVQWFIVHFFHDFTFLTLAAAMMYYIPLAIFIHEKSEDLGLSYIILMAFTFFQFSMTGIRQTMAFGCALMAIRALTMRKPKTISFILWTLIGMTFHKSCILTFLYYVIKKASASKYMVYGTLPLVISFFLFRTRLMPIVFMLSPIEKYQGYLNYNASGGGTTTYLVFVLLYIFGLFLYNKTKQERNDGSNFYLIVFGCATALQALVIENSIFFRAVWYFSIILTVYIPQLIYSDRLTNSSRKLINVIMYAGLLYMYLGMTIVTANVVPYVFTFSSQ